jgi:hypothetical protein
MSFEAIRQIKIAERDLAFAGQLPTLPTENGVQPARVEYSEYNWKMKSIKDE